MKTCFSLCEKMDPRLALLPWRNEPAKLSSMSNLLLLWTFPTIWVRQNELDIVLKRLPKTSMSLFDIRFGALEQVTHEVAQHLHGRLSLGKGGNIGIRKVRCLEVFCAEVELPPAARQISIATLHFTNFLTIQVSSTARLRLVQRYPSVGFPHRLREANPSCRNTRGMVSCCLRQYSLAPGICHEIRIIIDTEKGDGVSHFDTACVFGISPGSSMQ